MTLETVKLLLEMGALTARIMFGWLVLYGVCTDKFKKGDTGLLAVAFLMTVMV